MPAPLAHFEFMSEDPDKMQAFYREVFNWTFDNASMPGYTLVNTGEQPGGGLMKRPPQAPESRLNVYFKVNCLDDTMRSVEKAGGRVVVPRTHIPNVGDYAFITDPEGVVLGLFQG
jgi:hypothetical protein